MTSRDLPSLLHVDAHVHIYDAFDIDAMCAVALQRSAELRGPLLLLLSESDGFAYFDRLEGWAREGRVRAHGLRLEPTLEPESLALRAGDSAPSVFWIAGRQLVSAEGLEILALAWRPAPHSELRSGQPAAALVRGLVDAGALGVLPWGVGKWLGHRAALVDALVSDTYLRGHSHFFVGDIAHRCWPWPTPRAFRQGVRVLAGTDLLPLAGLERDVAAFGSRIEGSLDPRTPAASLRRALATRGSASSYGRAKSPLRMLAEQLRYRQSRRAARHA